MFTLYRSVFATVYLSPCCAERVPDGIYYERGVMDAWVMQLTIDPATSRSKFEFILNNPLGKLEMPYPVYFKVDDMPYRYDAEQDSLHFLESSSLSDPALPDAVKEMVEYFKPIGDFPIPVLAHYSSEDNTVIATIIALQAELRWAEEALDMEALMKNFETRKDGVRADGADELERISNPQPVPIQLNQEKRQSSGTTNNHTPINAASSVEEYITAIFAILSVCLVA